MQGKVYLIGAGPGEPGLLPSRSRQILKQADVIFHDRLIPPYFFDYHSLPARKLVDVGKLKNEPGTSQTNINKKMIAAAEKDQIVVRLKGGDPLIFGRGFEEIEKLRENSIPFQIIPAVSSLQGLASHLEVPLTHRDFSSGIGIITAHTARDDFKHNWEALAQLETLVVFMGVTRAKQVARKLLAAGKPANTPSLIAARLTRPDQVYYSCQLGELAENPQAAQDYRPGLIIIGETAAQRPPESWFEKLPLFGKKILLTRPPGQNQKLIRQIIELGGQPFTIPLLSPVFCRKGKNKLQKLLPDLRTYNWLVFCSQNGVKFFFQQLVDSGFDSRHLSQTKLACVGSATAQELQKHGLQADLIPERFTTNALGDSLLEKIGPDDRLLLLRAQEASDELKRQLEKVATSATQLPIYQLKPITNATEQIKELSPEELDFITFTSPSIVDRFFQIGGDRLLPGNQTVSIGPVTAKKLKTHGADSNIVASPHTAEGLLEALIQVYSNRTE